MRSGAQRSTVRLPAADARGSVGVDPGLPEDLSAPSRVQTHDHSGKKTSHTVKNVLPINTVLILLFLSETSPGRTHDKRIAEATPIPYLRAVGCSRIWASRRSRLTRWESSCQPASRKGELSHATQKQPINASR
jgi:hypothetical protein